MNKRPKLPKNRPLRDSAPDFTRGRRTLNRALSLVSDVIDLVDVPIPGKNLLSTLVNDAIERRRATARDELLRAISEGVTQPETAIIEQIDEFVAIGMRYEKAAMDGVRRQNLRLLARIVATQLEGRSANFERLRRKSFGNRAANGRRAKSARLVVCKRCRQGSASGLRRMRILRCPASTTSGHSRRTPTCCFGLCIFRLERGRIYTDATGSEASGRTS